MNLCSWITPCRIWPITFKLAALLLKDSPAHPPSAAWRSLSSSSSLNTWKLTDPSGRMCKSPHTKWTMTLRKYLEGPRPGAAISVTQQKVDFIVQLKSMIWQTQNCSYLQCLDRAMNGWLWCEEKESIQQRGRPPSLRNAALYSKHTDLLLLRPWDVARGLLFRKNGGRREHWMGHLF